jgi:excisionase family DNA binding protein
MSIKFKGENYYKTSEAARLAGISRSTLLRWIDAGVIKNASRRDRRGWRLFTEAEM